MRIIGAVVSNRVSELGTFIKTLLKKEEFQNLILDRVADRFHSLPLSAPLSIHITLRHNNLNYGNRGGFTVIANWFEELQKR